MYRKNTGVYIRFDDISSLGSTVVLAYARETTFAYLILCSESNRT